MKIVAEMIGAGHKSTGQISFDDFLNEKIEQEQYFQRQIEAQGEEEIKINIPLSRQRELGVIFVPHKEPRIWWSKSFGGEFGVHADMVVEEGGSLKDIMDEIMERAGVFDQGKVIVHFKFSIGPITDTELAEFRERTK